jgi:hypothetical protein
MAPLGEAASQKVTDLPKGPIGSFEASDTSEESMNHAFPHIETSIRSRRKRTLKEANGIIQQNLVIADVNAHGHEAF